MSVLLVWQLPATFDIVPSCTVAARPPHANRSAAQRVEAFSALMFDEIAIQESRGAPDPEQAAARRALDDIAPGRIRYPQLKWPESPC